MEDIGAAIRHYREINGLTQKELADKLSISPSTIGMYEQNRRTPDVNTLAAMSRLFGVSLEALIGTEGRLTILKDKEASGGFFYFFFDESLRDVFTHRIKKSLDTKGMSISELSQRVSFNQEKCEKYCKGDIQPSLEDLIELSQALDVSTDYLLGQVPPITNTEKKLLNAFVKLTEDNQDIIIGKTKELLREQPYDVPPVAAEGLRKASGK